MGAADVDMRVVAFDEARSIGIVRCRHEGVEMLRTAVACIAEVDGIRVLPRVRRISGTMKSLARHGTNAYVE